MIGIGSRYEHPMKTTPGGPLEVMAVSVTYVPEISWPVWHAAFGRDDLTGLWWYAPAAEALPVLAAALQRFAAERKNYAALLHPLDWRGVRGNELVLRRVIHDLTTHDDSVIAVGREDA